MTARLVEQVGAMTGQLHLPRGAVKETIAELILEFANEHARARWRDERPLRRAREAVMVGDEVKRARLPSGEFHS